jgi:hypothetical protein
MDGQLVEDGGPVKDRGGPLPGDVAVGEEEEFTGGLSGRESVPVFAHFAELAVIGFHVSGGVDQAADMLPKVEEGG